MTWDDPDAPVLVARRKSLLHIRLNRPKALNSLTLEMVEILAAALDRAERDGAIGLVFIDGAGERGFCAGGDIRAVADSGRAHDGRAEAFWRTEYAVNARIAGFVKPYVAFMDGITMGGGVGLSAHGSHRIVTERTRLAMPETGIGFIPDVGGTWLLARAPGETGTYMGLTGNSVDAADAIFTGFADHFMPSTHKSQLLAGLLALPAGATGSDVEAVIAALAQPAGASKLSAEQPLIDQLMSNDDASAIIQMLKVNRSPFALETAETILSRSPTSVKVTLALLRRARLATSLEACLDAEYAAACQTLRGHDFYEGVRAAVIDKDRTPRWSPATLSDVDPAVIAAHIDI
ncbi:MULTISPECIES: enoyl-CoA hydratase/isomerase family protein [unclassified Chelatococcus]|uniref:enoyl-CoA hydratase/isomerase family protein n=1 Tax=unclassified Chelatococcus TaxID=2638111 RepID=UPI001BCC7066|nr:enoyl-CoA hydratase/isomerase family protein [Chelatococcus sp.]MBS7696931.1 enoyl-CoA hydratase/isomerase family protein [Chelatococcus sp. YT9]MBX3555921.1 enoyl-CoA hydratase/isomerase family protein [Chelatococcus sp.]